MEYKRLITRAEVESGIHLWNREHPKFQIIPHLVAQNIFAPFAGVHSIAWGGYEDDQLVAFALIKYLSQAIPNSADQTLGWISLLVLDQRLAQSQVEEQDGELQGADDLRTFAGVLEAMLRHAEQDLAQRGVEKIRFGGDPQNFLPGLPHELEGRYLSLLEKLGYAPQGHEYDLYGDLDSYQPLVRVKRLEAERGEELIARPVTKEDEDALLEFLQTHFPGRWYYEADQIRRLPGGIEDYWLLWNQGTPVGFVRTNTSNSVYMGPNVNWGDHWGEQYCGLGPIGIDRQARGQGFGLYLMEMVIRSFQERGYRHMMIDWTQLVDYYQKIGFEPVIRYTTLIKELTE